jgi:hypothetical protein
MSIVADWTCAKSLKPILRRWKRRSTKSLNPCNLVWTQYIKNHQDTPKNPNPKISPPCCPWSGANGRRFPGAPGRGGGLSGEPRGTVLQPCFNRASTVLQPCFNRSTSLITPMDFTMELLPNPSTFRKNRKHVNQRFTILFTPVHCQSPTPLPHTL